MVGSGSGVMSEGMFGLKLITMTFLCAIFEGIPEALGERLNLSFRAIVMVIETMSKSVIKIKGKLYLIF